jgi:CheY-like chemotaxis protein
LTVADTGPGIPPELRSRIFEPFFTTKGAGHGTGLGLAVVYGVARSHGGAIEVAGDEGRGARFTLSLPLAPPELSEAEPPAPLAAPRPGSGTALVVDDDEMPRTAASAMLRALGYQPVAVGSSDEAERWAAEQGAPPEVILLDVLMPGKDGVACYAALRRRFPEAPVLFTSGFAPDGRAEAIVARREANLLPKPYTLRELAEALERARRRSGPGS